MRRLYLLIAAALSGGIICHAQLPSPVESKSGLRLVIAEEDTNPALHVVLPGRPDTDRIIYVLFPEHVTVRKPGEPEGKHIYLFSPGRSGDRPGWHKSGKSLQYEKDFEGGIHMLASAALDEDGVRFRYEFTNKSSTPYQLVYAPTDPRLTSIFHDVRLERTYVHHTNGFDLLASETPNRLTMPLDQWLPTRYLASFTWPVPSRLVERRRDGITYYNKSRLVDQPLIATLSADRKWVVASFSHTTGNVWSNPELTCQHVDPEISLSPRSTAAVEVKMLMFQGSLEDALTKAIAQRGRLE
ncbi:MAG TPA: hypothetical protein VMG82_03310 [Candidatus Sulfotelmatobacter sp.]|nr:hypothetical protein [Candidatus Sulfotelmatobacter sp.]